MRDDCAMLMRPPIKLYDYMSQLNGGQNTKKLIAIICWLYV